MQIQSGRTVLNVTFSGEFIVIQILRRHDIFVIWHIVKKIFFLIWILNNYLSGQIRSAWEWWYLWIGLGLGQLPLYALNCLKNFGPEFLVRVQSVQVLSRLIQKFILFLLLLSFLSFQTKQEEDGLGVPNGLGRRQTFSLKKPRGRKICIQTVLPRNF